MANLKPVKPKATGWVSIPPEKRRMSRYDDLIKSMKLRLRAKANRGWAWAKLGSNKEAFNAYISLGSRLKTEGLRAVQRGDTVYFGFHKGSGKRRGKAQRAKAKPEAQG